MKLWLWWTTRMAKAATPVRSTVWERHGGHALQGLGWAVLGMVAGLDFGYHVAGWTSLAFLIVGPIGWEGLKDRGFWRWTADHSWDLFQHYLLGPGVPLALFFPAWTGIAWAFIGVAVWWLLLPRMTT